MKKIFFIVFGALLLQACVPAAFVAGAAAGGAVIYDHRSTQTMLNDRNITFQSQSKIDANMELHQKAHISVAAFNQIVLIVGQAPTQELRDQAECIVKAQPGIKMLYNEVTIEKPIPDMTRANDTWITTKVKTVLFAEQGLHTSQIKVVTEDGVVYLMGLITHGQSQLATDKTRQVAGVKKVVKLFEYMN